MEIFQNLKQLQAFGKFGNADIFFPTDWQLVTSDKASMDSLGKTEWIERNQTCAIYNSVQIKVVYDDAGFKEFPQRYIIDI